MAIGAADVVRRLRELIQALDRRVPGSDNAKEAGIARDAASLRQKAEEQLTELADRPPVAHPVP